MTYAQDSKKGATRQDAFSNMRIIEPGGALAARDVAGRDLFHLSQEIDAGVAAAKQNELPFLRTHGQIQSALGKAAANIVLGVHQTTCRGIGDLEVDGPSQKRLKQKNKNAPEIIGGIHRIQK